MLAAAGNTAAKYALPLAGAVALSELDWLSTVDWSLAGAILIGLIGGAWLRASTFIDGEPPWTRIARDLLRSSMSGIANFIIAAVAVTTTDFIFGAATRGNQLPEVLAAGMGVIAGFRGNENVRWLARMLRVEDALYDDKKEKDG